MTTQEQEEEFAEMEKFLRREQPKSSPLLEKIILEMRTKPDPAMEELWEIRRKISEKIKDMTVEQILQRERDAVERFEQWRAEYKAQTETVPLA
jgi:hypothetical protein